MAKHTASIQEGLRPLLLLHLAHNLPFHCTICRFTAVSPAVVNVSGCSAPSTRLLTASKHLALHLLRLIVLSLAREGYSKIARGIKPLLAVLCTTAHLRPPRIRQPITHLASEWLLARLARPPPLGAYLLLHERLRRLNAAAVAGSTE